MEETDVNEEEPVVHERIDNRLFRFLVMLITVKPAFLIWFAHLVVTDKPVLWTVKLVESPNTLEPLKSLLKFSMKLVQN